MSFPTHVATTTYDNSSVQTTAWTPFTGQNYLGQFLVFIAVEGGAPTMTTASAGWSKLTQVDGGNDLAVFYKLSGSSSESITVDMSTEQRMMGILMRFTDADEVSGTAAEGNDPAVDPPSHSLSTTTEAIWVAVESHSGGETTTAGPSGYTGFNTETGVIGTVSVARKSVEASSENPGAFTHSGDAQNQNIGMTLAVYSTTGQGYAGMVL